MVHYPGFKMSIDDRLQRISIASGFDLERLRNNYARWHLRIGPAKAEQLITDKEKEFRLKKAS